MNYKLNDKIFGCPLWLLIIFLVIISAVLYQLKKHGIDTIFGIPLYMSKEGLNKIVKRGAGHLAKQGQAG